MVSRSTPRDLNRAFEACTAEILKLSSETEVDDLEQYRSQVHRATHEHKRIAGLVVTSGHQDGLLLLAKLSTHLMDCLKTSQPVELKEILADTLSDCFPFNGPQFLLLSRMSLSDDLLVKAFLQALTQEESPGDILCNKMSLLPPDRFMSCWLAVLADMAPAPDEIEPGDIYKPLQSLHQHLHDRNNIPGGVESFAAHLEQLRPVLRYLLDNSTVQGLRIVKGVPGDQVEPKVRKDTIGDVTKIRQALGFNAEFLFNLYGVTQDPIVLEIAEVAIHQPSGLRPYEFYDQLGLARSREWHLEQQIKSSSIKLVRLYEHAICTDGLDLDVSKVRREKLIAVNPEVRDLFLKLFRTVPLDKPGVQQKAQLLLDAFVAHCMAHDNDPLRVSFIEGGLPPVLFAKHNKWLGQQFINELGV
jgi:hypothetical protein